MPAGVSAWTPLANITLSGSASTITFSSISGSYRDLVLVATNIAVSTPAAVYIRFNSDSASTYSSVLMAGSGSSTSSATTSTTRFEFNYFAYPTTTPPYGFMMNMLDYSATDKHKTALMRVDQATQGVESYAGRWPSTAAISTITLSLSAGTYSAGSSFALYGVSA